MAGLITLCARQLYLHLDGSLGTKVGLEDFLESLSGIDVDTESGSFTDLIGFGVNELKSRHILFKVLFKCLIVLNSC
jgi:hypothetical protein